MVKNKLCLVLSIAAAMGLTACGGGDGDADKHVVRNLFAVGDVVDALEDGGAVEGDVSKNDRGEGLTFALMGGSAPAHGTLVFNADGTFTYTPEANYHGKDTFSYVATQTATGDTATALVTMNVKNDYEELEEYGWTLVWSDEFASAALDTSAWAGVNASVSDGALMLNAFDGATSSAKLLTPLRGGRVEASIQVPDGNNILSVFSLMPMADMFDGENLLAAMESNGDRIIAGAHYGLGLVSAVELNAPTLAAAKIEYHNYAIEWNEEQIRWYVDGLHVHTVNPLNTWSYNLSGETVVPDISNPFVQDLQLSLELSADASALPTSLMVDYVKVWSCDASVATEVDACASAVNKSINKAASDRIETVGPVTTPVYTDAIEELTWHHTDEVGELSIGTGNGGIPLTLTELDLANERGIVLDISSPEVSGYANVSFVAPGVGFVGKGAALQFDMYIDSAATTATTLDLRMETGWPYMGMFTWNIADLQTDTWVTYTIPVSDFVNNPFLAPGWLNWIAGVSEGDPLPLDPSNVNNLLTLEYQAPVHLQLDNVRFTCISNESCIQAPLVQQPIIKAGPAPIRYEAETDYVVVGEVQTEATADVDGDLNVGYIDAGDSLQYTIVAPLTGTYSLQYRLASAGGSTGFEVVIDGEVMDTQAVADTGGWQVWVTQESGEFELEAGEHTVLFRFLGGAINFNWFAIVPPPFELLVEAEAWTAAGDVQTEDTADEGGGLNVGYIDAGDFLEYDIDIPAAGTYFIEYRLASNGGSAGFEVRVGGALVDMQAVGDTGGWQNWTTQTAEVQLPGGSQTLRLDFIGGAININWIKITN